MNQVEQTPDTTKGVSPSATQTPPPPPPLPTPIITTPRFIIRTYHPSDIDPMAALLDNIKIARYMRNTFPHPYKRSDAEYWIDLVNKPDATIKAYGIFIPDDDDEQQQQQQQQPPSYKLAGGIGLQPHADIEERTMNLGYWMGEPYWNLGIMTEAAIAFTRWALRTMPVEVLTRLDGSVFEGNVGSMRVMTKTGFKHEGVRRKAVYKYGELLDVNVYGLLREDLDDL